MSDPKIDVVQAANRANESRESSMAAENGASEAVLAAISYKLYAINLTTWGIYNDGTHPSETEKGINAAIIWAKNNGYEGVYLKEGMYLIEPTYYADPVNKTGARGVPLPFPASSVKGGERGIQPASNSIFEMHRNCIIKTNPNNAHVTVSISICDKDNVTIIGGQIAGDRDTHLFTYYAGYGIGGMNHGLVAQRSKNIKVYDTKFVNHGGDGVLLLDNMGMYRMNSDIYMKNVVCDNNMRQGMSIVGGDSMVFEDCVFSGSNGQSPEYGVDIEAAYSSTNIVFRRCRFTKNNRGGLINASGTNLVLENCTFTQGLGYHPAYGIQIKDCTFDNQDYVDYYKKYPYLLTPGKAYAVGDRARLDYPITSEGFTCIKAGSTSGAMNRKNNWPPAEIQSSLLGIVYTYGTTEWVHSDNFYSYGDGGGVVPSAQPFLPALPINSRENNRAYSVGNQVRLSDGTAVVCTVTGSSGASAPNTTGKYLGDTITDGNVTWKIVDNVFPKTYRKNSAVYAEGDLIWWGDDTIWECVTGGTTAAAEPTLKDLPFDAILIAHASTSRIKKVAFDANAPDWTPNMTKNLNDKVNIAGTTWQYVSRQPYNIIFGNCSTGDKEPRVTDLAKELLLTDGTVVWKKGNSGINCPVATTLAERCIVENTKLMLSGPIVKATNNLVINGDYMVTARQLFSTGNVIRNDGIPTKKVTYAANEGNSLGDIIHNSIINIVPDFDFAIPQKRLVENLVIKNSTINNSKGILHNCTLVFSEPIVGTNLGPSINMIGGEISAYLYPSTRLFAPYRSQFSLQGVIINITLNTGSYFFKGYTKAADGFYSKIQDCIFNITPLGTDVTLFSLGYGDGNVQLANNKFFNSDHSKSINVILPTGDAVNTFNRCNYFDVNYYSTDINSGNNIGGYAVRTTVDSSGVPVKGSYALGTRIMNITPAIGSPKSWLVTTDGLAYSKTRENSTAYAVGTFVKWPSGNNIYECIGAGTTAASAPAAGRGTVIDGTIVWLYRGNKTAVFTSEGKL
ncbi:right-handed parallel beta-helix repeat-containing protein [Sporomusa malonica]|uniref:Right handed beta helix region n=1 Tax=Sporomusa malonica TaxID=112901 RepID=A0A1W2DKX4_9FIRM|nr:right-handed parallel beta-helix repeat-containing protein [Sporomusa malonica]SMC98097.1 Right handed beta helix region [Sporomusa malonica]